MDNPLILYAIAFGAVTAAILGYLDFHTPYRISEIRYGALRERYYLSIAIYVSAVVLAYGIVLYGLVAALRKLTGQPSSAVIILSLALAPVVLLFGRKAPGIASLVAWLRTLLQRTFARYPLSIETLSALIARGQFRISSHARSEVIRDLDCYGVPSQIIDSILAEDDQVLSPTASAQLQELCSLHLSLSQLRKDSRFKKYFSARDDVVYDLEKAYRACMRRAARAVLIVADTSISEDAANELTLDISDFVAEECDLLIERYHRILAEMAVSCLPGPAARTQFISEIGYHIRPLKTLPFIPMLAVFVLDFAISVAPVAIVSIPENVRMPIFDTAKMAFAHSIALTLAVFWAIYPKSETNFARPSLYSLPWLSYVVFGAASYVLGTAILYLAFKIVPVPAGFIAAKYPLIASAYFSILFAAITVVMSILLDIRLQNPLVTYSEGRLRDGLVVALAMAVTIGLLQLGIPLLAGALNVPAPDFGLAAKLSFTGLFAALGFAIGFLLPSTAEAHMDANKVILGPEEFAGERDTSGLRHGGIPWSSTAA